MAVLGRIGRENSGGGIFGREGLNVKEQGRLVSYPSEVSHPKVYGPKQQLLN